MTIRKSTRRIKFPHGPIRTCVLCRVKAPKEELVRFSSAVKVPGNEIKGRGIYVCSEHDSEQIRKNTKKLAKALRCDVEALHFNLKGKIRS